MTWIQLQITLSYMENMKECVNDLQVDMAGLATTVKIVGGLILSGITALIIMGLTP